MQVFWELYYWTFQCFYNHDCDKYKKEVDNHEQFTYYCTKCGVPW